MRHYGKPLFEYKGYYYCPDDMVEPDVIKTWHDVKVLEDGKYVDYNYLPESPYRTVGIDDFMLWVDCDMPDRKTLNGYVSDKIQDYYNKWQDEQINQVILGEE